MHRRRFNVLAAAALVVTLAGCAPTPNSPPAAAATHAAIAAPSTTPPPPKPTATKKVADYPAIAKRYIDENVCISKPAGCSDIKRYGLIGDFALVAYTDLYPDSDAAAPAQSICGYLLMYVNDSKVSADDLSSTAYVYGSTGSRITKCATPLDR